MKRCALMIAFVLSCTSDGKARATLDASGYTNVQLTGYDWGGCAKSDDTCTGFTATAPNGHRISGAVGCGYNLSGCGKGCTVRIEP